ncbi:STAS-like domain-containing protein [Viridibacillus sp. FSL E2-0187]|uniref:STAS-like domain-containing protein n=1 Tax=Viridibacillus sp. FSL E2-0187 TaxID=2921362 RepID=UPI0030F96894
MVITVSVLDYVDSCYSNDDGAVVFEIIDSLLNKKNKVIVSFEGINSITSSFTNTAFVELIKKYDMDFVKQNLSFVKSNKAINQMIKSRFDFFSNNLQCV